MHLHIKTNRMHARATLHLASGWLVCSGEKNQKAALFSLKNSMPICQRSDRKLSISANTMPNTAEACLSISEPGKRPQHITNKQTNVLSVISYITINIMSVAYNSTLQQTLTQALAPMSKIYCNFRNSSRFRKEWERKSNL